MRSSPFHHRSGGSLVPVLIIVAALVISAVVFFTFTRKHLPGPPPAAQDGTTNPQQVTGAPAPANPTAPVMPEPAGPVRTAPTGSAAPTPAPPAALGFARPLDLGAQFVRSLSTGDLKAAAKIASAADPSQAAAATAVLGKIFTDMGYKIGADDKVELLGQVENFTRLSIPLIKPGEPGANLRLQLDVERDDKMGWKIAKLHLPKELSSALAALPPMPTAPAASAAGTPSAAAGPDGKPLPAAAPAATSSSAGNAAGAPAMQKSASLFAVAETADALTFAADFVQALLKHDFAVASRFIDQQKVQPQKLAGLCIVFEEGQYSLKPAKPLIITVANPEVSWVIAQVQSETLQQSTEFGLELQRPSPAAEWRVVGLNLSEILGSFAQSAAKLGVPYTPLVKNPRGGESLALYFEYDRAELHPRARKQLEIVAGLLKSDAGRKLNIAGHTDAKGEDSYNLRLSQGRAEAVKQQLVALGVSPDQVITSGMGKAQPLGPNQKADGTDDPEGRSKNRRAEIFLDF